ncbi:MAG: SWIM zinc finger family protein [Chloroflexi bacterium]|nr:SWIM zinc finger family protein [Chloroflexota bacterium]
MALTPTQATTAPATLATGTALHAADQLQLLAQLTPATLRRLERAFALLRQGAVQAGCTTGSYWVRSQRTGDQYLVTVTGQAVACTCPDAAAGALCKHALAVVLHRRLGGGDAPPPVAARRGPVAWPMRCDAGGVDPDAPIPYRLVA